jgi:two-component system chemotaxis response regulator CheB
MKDLHVLVVDDSAVVRQVLTAVLQDEPGISVSVAPDPLLAMERMKNRRPDVIVLDLEMPRMDGLTFLRKLMAEDPLPVVICSAHVGGSSAAAVEALAEGAVDLITKPQLGIKGFLEESAQRLIDTVRGAAQAQPLRHRLRGPSAPARPPPARISNRPPPDYVVAVGASTGGTEALHRVLEPLPKEAPPLVVVQHMPEGFTTAFARSLDRRCSVQVKEAASGDAVVAGRVLLARGNHHIELVRRGARFEVALGIGPLVNRHRPSVDVLFRSVARVAGRQAVGVLLTGMGSDGSEGLLEMRRAGARTIAQDRDSSVVFGMPKAAIDRGAASEVLALDLIGSAILAGP